MSSKLTKIEVFFYFICVVSLMIKLLMHVYYGSDTLVKHLGGDADILPGFKWIHRLQDKSDYEWLLFVRLIISFAPLFVLYLVISDCVKSIYPDALPLWYFIISIFFLTFNFNIKFCCLVLIQSLVIYFFFYWNLALAVWPVSISYIILDYFYLFPELSLHQHYMVNYAICWNSLKYIDFGVSNRHNERSLKGFLNYIAYIYYFPLLSFGPFLPYENFISSLYNKPVENIISRLVSLVISLLRFFMWSILIEVSLHYFYCNAFQYHLNTSMFNNLWFLNGVGFCMAQFFYLKYLVIYGSMGSIAKFEGIETPPPPRCVNTVHLYSNMWRHFDRGYYLFTIKNIYFPLQAYFGSNLMSKLCASFVSFCFVLIWHGINYTVFLWTLLNFIGISLEAVGKICFSLISPVLENFFSPQTLRRIACLLITPVWILAVCSNAIFFGGHKYGLMVLSQFFLNGWKVPIIGCFFGYCFSQLSVEIESSRIYTKQKVL